jgi:hypothetical protein
MWHLGQKYYWSSWCFLSACPWNFRCRETNRLVKQWDSLCTSFWSNLTFVFVQTSVCPLRRAFTNLLTEYYLHTKVFILRHHWESCLLIKCTHHETLAIQYPYFRLSNCTIWTQYNAEDIFIPRITPFIHLVSIVDYEISTVSCGRYLRLL